MTERIDRLIKDIRDRWQAAALAKPEKESGKEPADVLIVAHGHILRAFAQRWVRHTLQEGPTFLLEAGGVGTLR